MIYKKNWNIVLIGILSIVSTNLIGQTTKELSSEKSKKESVIDSAFLRVVYVFTQQATKDHEAILIADTMALTVGENWSVYYDWNKSRRDSISKIKNSKILSSLKNISVIKGPDSEVLARLESNNIKPETTGGRIGESAKIFKKRADNTIITFDKGPNEMTTTTYLRVTEKNEPIVWKISDETETLRGYLCQKATATTRGRTYTVWFTMDIPVNDGPWKLYGLPGMILSGKSDEGLFSFQAIGIQQLDNETIRFPSDKKINDAKNLKQLNDYRRIQFKKLNVSYLDNGNMIIYRKKNPVEYVEIETE